MSIPKFTPTFHKAPYPRIAPSLPSLSCTGKTVFITGGGGGIGRAIARNFAEAGANVFIVGRSEANLRDTVAELSELASSGASTEGSFDYQAVDITDQAGVESAFASAVKKFGDVDIVVNNAGFMDSRVPIVSADLEDWWRSYETNVKGGFIVLQQFLKLAKPGATFINISSGLAHVPYFGGHSAYSSSKAAFARVCELAQGENPELRVFNVQPGSIFTEGSKKTKGLKQDDDIGRVHPKFAAYSVD
jgi:NAD(P)-dependent dehydrogenase (short-subunit alcohol dehydrogenase family)